MYRSGFYLIQLSIELLFMWKSIIQYFLLHSFVNIHSTIQIYNNFEALDSVCFSIIILKHSYATLIKVPPRGQWRDYKRRRLCR